MFSMLRYIRSHPHIRKGEKKKKRISQLQVLSQTFLHDIPVRQPGDSYISSSSDRDVYIYNYL